MQFISRFAYGLAFASTTALSEPAGSALHCTAADWELSGSPSAHVIQSGSSDFVCVVKGAVIEIPWGRRTGTRIVHSDDPIVVPDIDARAGHSDHGCRNGGINPLALTITAQNEDDSPESAHSGR